MTIASSKLPPPPGRLVSGPGGVSWNGPLAWQLKHGRHATTGWVAGVVTAIDGALLYEGSRGTLFKPGNPDTGGWRRTDGDGGWIHGRIEIRADDVLFHDDVPQPEAQTWQAGTLFGDIVASAEIRSEAADFDGACDLYGALCSIGWRSNRSGKEYWGTWRRAAELVASIRGLGECYTDFFLMGNEGELTAKMRDLLAHAGWMNIGLGDRKSRNRRAIGILQACEQRNIGPTPDWYRTYANGLSFGKSLDNRMHVYAVSGRATLEEWDLFWENLDIGTEGPD